MKNIRRWFVLACLATANLVGCVAASTDTGSQITAPATETTVVTYTVEDLARLGPTDTLRIDLTALDTVYVVEYSNPEQLTRVVVVNINEQYLLSERETTPVLEGTFNRIVLAGDPTLAAEFVNPSQDTTTAHTEEGNIGTAEQALRPLCCDDCHCDPWGCTCWGCVPC